MSNELAIQSEKRASLFDEDKFVHWMNVSQKLSTSDMVPKGYKGKPMDILVAMEMGKQVGLSMMQSLQNIAVINGKPSMYGDAVLAVCQSHPHYEWIKEEPIYKGSNIDGYKCSVKRRNHEEHTVVFTVDDAKKASLWGKPGPWTQYPSRMLQMRARVALRNVFADALQGIYIAEEAQDIQTIDGELVSKPKQNDKLQSLLNKKGLNHATNAIDVEVVNHHDNPVTIDSDNRVLDSNNHHAQSADQAEVRARLVENGEPQSSGTNPENDVALATESQLESVTLLFSDKGLDKARRLKALYHFGVTSIEELSVNQADEMIKILNRIE